MVWTHKIDIAKDFFSRNLKKISCLFIFLSVLTIAISGLSFGQDAGQEKSPPFLMIEDVQDYLTLTPYISFIKDDEEKINLRNIKDLHQTGENLLSSRQNILNLGGAGTPYWIVFDVRNRTNTSKWVLDLGDFEDGRIGFLNELFIINLSRGEVLARYLSSNDTEKPVFRASSKIRLSLESGQLNTIAIYVSPHSGMPVTLVPELKTEAKALDKAGDISLFDIAFFGLSFMFAALMVFGGVVRNIFAKFFYVIYCLGIISVYVIFKNFFLIQDSVYSSLPVILMLAALLCGVVGTALHTCKTLKQIALNLSAVFIPAFLVMGVFAMFFASQPLGLLSFSAPAFILLLGCLYMSYTSDKTELGPIDFISWMFPFLGLVVSTLATTGVLTPNVFYLHAFWSGFLLQGILMTFSSNRFHQQGTDISLSDENESSFTKTPDHKELKKVKNRAEIKEKGG